MCCAGCATAYPDAHGSDTGVLVKSLHEEISGRAAPMLRMLLAAVAVMLLVACANIANLFLMQGSARRRELAVRAAIGATRGRIISQLVTEAAVLGLVGGALGVLVARGLVQRPDRHRSHRLTARRRDRNRLEGRAVSRSACPWAPACFSASLRQSSRRAAICATG